MNGSTAERLFTDCYYKFTMLVAVSVADGSQSVSPIAVEVAVLPRGGWVWCWFCGGKRQVNS